MITINVIDFEDWRAKARVQLDNNASPETLWWQALDTHQVTLFAHEDPPIKLHEKIWRIPKAFFDIGRWISHHRSPNRWNDLYQLLWRLTHGEKHLLMLKTDVLIQKLWLMQKAVQRDAHKMKAFVRFCKNNDEASEHYLAWYMPDHIILRLVAPFFQRRFAVMHWTIVTPDESVHWNGQELIYSAGQNLTDNPQDKLESLWRTYYKAIFNPARVKIAAMKREMPVRYWHNLPETKLIPELLATASVRVEKMLSTQEGFNQSAADYLPPNLSIENLKQYAQNCQGCSLHHQATQTVFGVGNIKAALIIVGEQPGDTEDSLGQPFIGPAGTLLTKILINLSIDKEDIYLTNAVKHFKFIAQANYRQHRSPSIKEINACKPWVLAEIATIKPKIVLCLGLTAAKSLINPAFHMKQDRGKWFSQASYLIGASYHPSAVLRAVDSDKAALLSSYIEQDIASAYQLSQS